MARTMAKNLLLFSNIYDISKKSLTGLDKEYRESIMLSASTSFFSVLKETSCRIGRVNTSHFGFFTSLIFCHYSFDNDKAISEQINASLH